MTPERKVHKIESHVSLIPAAAETVGQKRRVAAYARVSTDSDEQLSSYEAQVDFYTCHIKSNPEWEFAGVYTDEGISGTNTRKRDGFNRMMADALAGRIDLILTKSISRFARNTVDTLTAIRRLKEKKVEVYFEKENIYTLDAKGEVMITIMSSLAQEESRSISENVTWGKRKSMADGKFSLAYKHFLGYEKGEDGLPKIVEKEAEIVREIYRLFLEGQTVRMIADHLTAKKVPTPRGKEKWSVSTIMSILTNEKYKGDALLQKTYTSDFLTKTVKRNHGEVPQYYIQNSHPFIIKPETFELVQQEIRRRRPKRRQLHRSSPFTAKIICGDCGGYYGRKVWHSGSPYEKSIWRCNRKYGEKDFCTTPNLKEKELEQAFVTAFNWIWKNRERHLSLLGKRLTGLGRDIDSLEEQLEAAGKKHRQLLENLRDYMEANTRQVQDRAEYGRRFAQMDAACQKAEGETARLEKEILEKKGQKERMHRYIKELHSRSNQLDGFDGSLWELAVESVTVSAEKGLLFRFRDGTDVPVKLPVEIPGE